MSIEDTKMRELEIEQVETDTFSFLSAIVQKDNQLKQIAPEYISWAPGDKVVTLDGEFTAEQLMAISIWIKTH